MALLLWKLLESPALAFKNYGKGAEWDKCVTGNPSLKDYYI